MVEKIIYSLAGWMIFAVCKVEFMGWENIPKDGKFILASNHLGFLDGPIGLVLLYKRGMKKPIITVAEKYQKYIIYRWLVNKLDYLFIDRFNADFLIIRKVIRRLNAGGYLAIAPEGTRSPNGSLIEARNGTAYLASKTGSPIIPIGAIGIEDSLIKKQLLRLRRLDVRIQTGLPFSIPELPKTDREIFLKAQTDEIMCRIAAILPKSYRGFYSDHPRLKELLKTQPIRGEEKESKD